jgi:hypothetical protein
MTPSRARGRHRSEEHGDAVLKAAMQLIARPVPSGSPESAVGFGERRTV